MLRQESSSLTPADHVVLLTAGAPTGEDAAERTATLVQLAEVLRATLALGDANEASLDFELRLARGYAGVMAARFDGRVTIAWDVDDALLGQPLPAMSLQPLLEKIEQGAIDPSVVITHKLSLDDAPDAYRRFRDKEDGCIKVMLRP